MNYFDDLCDSIDATVFNGDHLHDKDELEKFIDYIERWKREINRIKKQLISEDK